MSPVQPICWPISSSPASPSPPASPPWRPKPTRTSKTARRAPPNKWKPKSPPQRRALQLVELPAGNFELAAYNGLLLKDSYWRWPERNLAGNAIDFFVQVLGLSFHDAMRQITGQ
ncbi:MAG: hypothetical protein WCI73_08875 [Phycisphaerae bacterium]